MTIKSRLDAISAQIDRLNIEHKVHILAVSKQQPIDKILKAYEAGLRNFGENYCQEALIKIAQLKDYAIDWHYIGQIQRNKVKKIAHHFDWVHSLDCPKIAMALNTARTDMPNPLKVFIQLNISNEVRKQGINPQSTQSIETLLETLKNCPNLALQGLMALPAQYCDSTTQLAVFQSIKDTLMDINKTYGLSLKALSMGTSADYLNAALAGATWIRLGTSVFGPRA